MKHQCLHAATTLASGGSGLPHDTRTGFVDLAPSGLRLPPLHRLDTDRSGP